MAGQGQAHVASAPVISAATPFLGPGAISLGSLAIVEEEPRIAFEGIEHAAVRKNPRVSNKIARPVPTPFSLARVQQHQILAWNRIGMVAVGRVKIADLIRASFEGFETNFPLNIRQLQFLVWQQL